MRISWPVPVLGFLVLTVSMAGTAAWHGQFNPHRHRDASHEAAAEVAGQQVVQQQEDQHQEAEEQDAPGRSREVGAHPAALVRPVPPPSLAAFWSWPELQRERAVTALEHQNNWSEGTRLFLKAAIRSRELGPVTRNNIANGLVRQLPPDPNGIHVAHAIGKIPIISKEYT
jgi:hypothetical protein